MAGSVCWSVLMDQFDHVYVSGCAEKCSVQVHSSKTSGEKEKPYVQLSESNRQPGYRFLHKRLLSGCT
jgi:hypothetical protein